VRFNKPSCYFDTTWQWKLALPAGVAPASFRLEDECLIYFGHGSNRLRTCEREGRNEVRGGGDRSFRIPRFAIHVGQNGQRGRSCTCDPPVPSRVRWLLRYALFNPTPLKSGWVGNEADNLGNRFRGKMHKSGGPEGSRTLSLPADNGLLR
jgi:hypothetical protein